MIIAGQNFRTNRDVNNFNQNVVIKNNKDDYNSTSIENIAVSTTKIFNIGSFHTLVFTVKGGTATVTIGSQSSVAVYDGQSINLSYKELNDVTITIVTDNNATVLCTIKTI